MRARTLALALLLSPALVGAEPDKGDVPRHAKQLAERGRAAHAAGDYGNAIVAYRAAYGLAPSPSLLFNIAQAYRLAGDCESAVKIYRRFLEERPRPELRSLAKTHAERCATDPKAARTRSARAEGTAPAEDGDTWSAPAGRARLQRRLGVGMIVTGAVAIGFASYYALDARDASLTVEDAYARGVKWRDIRSVAESGDRSAAIAKTLGVGGGLTLAGGITLYILGKRAERALPATIVPTRGGAEVSFAWQF